MVIVFFEWPWEASFPVSSRNKPRECIRRRLTQVLAGPCPFSFFLSVAINGTDISSCQIGPHQEPSPLPRRMEQNGTWSHLLVTWVHDGYFYIYRIAYYWPYNNKHRKTNDMLDVFYRGEESTLIMISYPNKHFSFQKRYCGKCHLEEREKHKSLLY